MDKVDITVAATPDGRETAYTTTPGAVLYGQNSHYGFTGVVNRAWIEATNIVGRPYTSQEIGLGWPLAMEPHRLAALQCPKDPTGQHYINTALLSACAYKTISRVAFQRHDYGLMPGGRHELIEAWMDYAITAHDFATWLARQGEEPSPHIAAWFKAVGVAPAAAAKPPAPAPTAAPTSASDAPVTTVSTSEPPAWRVTAPARYRGYTLPLFNVLSAAHRAGEPRPTARDVLEAWRTNQPQEIAQVLADGFNYYDSTGNTKAAGIESLRKAIERMTNAR